MEFDITIGGINSTSYVSVEDAKDYFKYRQHSELWAVAGTANHKVYLMSATRILDRYVKWNGIKATKEQSLEWPRVGVVDKNGYVIESTEIPKAVRESTLEMAYSLIEEDPTAASDMDGISSLKVGPLSIVADTTFKNATIPDAVKYALDSLGVLVGSGQVKTVRT